MIDVAALNLTTVIIIAGILGYLIERVIDAKGWSRSSRTLRRENEDLVRRNVELEATVARHEHTIAQQGEQLAVLEARVHELGARDQQAVLHALELHASQADRRHAETAARHAEAVGVWMQIRDALASSPGKETS